MCRKCSGWRSEVTGQWIEGDGDTSRHTVMPPDPGHPNYGAWIARKKRRERILAESGVDTSPIVHGTVRAIRSHKRKDEDLCDACDSYWRTPAYWKDLRLQSLATVNRKLEKMTEWMNDGGDVDAEEWNRLKRKRDRLEVLLSGEGQQPKIPVPRFEPLADPVLIKFTKSQDAALRQRSKSEDVALSHLVRQAVAAFLVSADHMKELEDRAEEEDTTVAELVRQALDAFFLL